MSYDKVSFGHACRKVFFAHTVTDINFGMPVSVHPPVSQSVSQFLGLNPTVGRLHNDCTGFVAFILPSSQYDL